MGQQDGQIVGGQPDGRKEDQRRDGDDDFGPFKTGLSAAEPAVAVVEVMAAMVSELQAV